MRLIQKLHGIIVAIEAELIALPPDDCVSALNRPHHQKRDRLSPKMSDRNLKLGLLRKIYQLGLGLRPKARQLGLGESGSDL